jgi:molybdopterin-guanine dinucleotide biosynthesis protein A
MAQRVGLVLAGGRGRRMGRTKGDLQLEGRSLAQRAAETLWPLCGSVLVSVGPGAPNPAPDYPLIEDEPPAGRGPLAGIDAAFRRTGEADLLVLACDYPNAGPELLGAIVERAGDGDELVMPIDRGGRDHPLVALWRRATAERVAGAVARERFKVRALLADFQVSRLGGRELPELDLEHALLNVNRNDELEALRRGARSSAREG